MPSPKKSGPAKPRNGPSGSPDPILSEPSPKQALGEAFLLIHGLNLHPGRMGAWREVLLDRGCAVALLCLTGHTGEGRQGWRGAGAKRWLADIDQAYAVASEKWPGVPVSLFGYSLGALAGMVWSLKRERPWRRAVLLAPALRMHWIGSTLLALGSRLLPHEFPFASWTPRSYRANATVPLSAFLAVRELSRRFQEGLTPPGDEDRPGRGNNPGAAAPRPDFPQFVIVPKGDELISTRYMTQYGKRIGPPVTLYTLRQKPFRGYPRHLVVNPQTVGQPQWNDLVGALTDWLEAT